MNRFQVKPGSEAEFERVWRERDIYLRDLPPECRCQQASLCRRSKLRGIRGDTDGEVTSR
ncbi:MAG TPA: hypothetical protein VFZ03_18740 [Dongiaceae bacterium]